MKRFLPILILTRLIIIFFFISWELNAQIALPTFQGAQFSAFGLYSFSSHTFTNCGAPGKDGPTLANCTGTYSPSWTDNTNYFNVPSNAGIQYWTVPSSGTYTIEVWGAQGGNSYNGTNAGGRGARMKGNFSLTKGEILKILVGQQGGQSNSTNYGGGGGGGTFVAQSNNTALIVAGGGGGSAVNNSGNGNTAAQTTTSGRAGGNSGGSGGSNGNGGSPGSGAPSGGAGFTGNGNGGWTGGGGVPKSFINGGTGQGLYGNTCCGGMGAFGGGSTGHGGGGGGGGYSGGGGGGGCCSSSTSGGGGGGSYNNGSSEDNSAGVRDSHGQVTITRI